MVTKADRVWQRRKEAQNMRDLLDRYTAAVRNHESRGAQRLEDQEAIHREYDAARALIEANIGYLINKAYS